MAVLTVKQILTGAELGLTSGLDDLLVLDLSGRRVLYALDRAGNKLIEVDVGSSGALSYADSLVIQGAFTVGSEPLLGAATLNGSSHLALSGLPASDGQGVMLSAAGALGTQVAFPSLGTLIAPQSFDAVWGAALVSGAATGGLDLYTDTGNGMAWTATLADTSTLYLADVAGSAYFTQFDTDFVATVSATENGVNITSVEPGAMTQSAALGAAEGLPVDLPSDISVLQRLDETLLFVASSGTSSLSSIRVESGVPVLADHVLDTWDTSFQGATALATATQGDFAFVAVGGSEGGVSLLTALPGGRLVHLASLADNETVPLYRLSAVELSVAGATLQIFATSHLEVGITRLSYDISNLGEVVFADWAGSSAVGGSGDDQLIGSDVGEALSGGAGADILFDGAGVDTLTGGLGADLFVLHPDGQADEITDFERGVDKLDLSAFDFLYDVGQLGFTTTSNGAVLTHGLETITIVTSDALPLSASELTNADVLNVDRPPILAIGQDLMGGAGNDTLNGSWGDDTIVGAAGDDLLWGLSGSDSIVGGSGMDSLDGGSGDDTLRGQSGADTLVGGAGSDLIFGDGGDDVIYGEDYDWGGT